MKVKSHSTTILMKRNIVEMLSLNNVSIEDDFIRTYDMLSDLDLLCQVILQKG